MRCRRDRHHDSGVSGSPYPPRTRRVPSAFVRRYETDRVASCSSRLVQQGLGNVARRVLEQCSVMLDLARSFPVGKGKPDTAALPDLVVEISAQEGRQGRGLLDDRQAPKSAILADIPSKLRVMPMTNRMFRVGWPHASFRSSRAQATSNPETNHPVDYASQMEADAWTRALRRSCMCTRVPDGGATVIPIQHDYTA